MARVCQGRDLDKSPFCQDGLPPCAHLLKIALNALSGSGAMSCFPLYSGRRPLGLPTPSCRGKNRTRLSPSRIWDGLGPNFGQPNSRCGITCDSRDL
ncbi:hypothetical protein PanWU01x14_122950 [Parasponia andersonii]|uniref:Uncharacterized protein n=1 Tax=Parasponia andersonii TaxID=3476 RepID=A0A2P5CU48_PARAD|nr:hypothetical protein PanWU01x14_122950 [Parasponia andersonii]